MAKDKIIIPGGVDEYIARCPDTVRPSLMQLRAIIQDLAPGSVETVSYFQIPGYSYEGYDYSGMFAWFSFKEPYVRLHVRPPVIENNKDKLKGYTTTKSIVSFSVGTDLPAALIKQLVQESIDIMRHTTSP